MLTCTATFQHGPRARHPRPPVVRLHVRRVFPRRERTGSRLARHAGVRGVGVDPRVGLRARLDARGRAVRPLLLHGRHTRARVVHRRRPADGRPLVHVPRLRGVLPRAGRAGTTQRGLGAGDHERHSDDAARRRDRSHRAARRPVVPRAHLLLCGGRRVLRRAALELRGLGPRRHRRRRRLSRADARRPRMPERARNRVILRGACVQSGGDGVDPGVGPARSRPAIACRDRRCAVRWALSAGHGAGHGEPEGMSVPLSQMWTVATYVLKQRLRRNRRYPLVLMLEPLFRCNLACAGCGKIQYPGHILRKHLSVEQCLGAVDECGAPMVSIPGGEPLMYPEIGPLVQELVKRRKYVYLCTNAILLKEKLEAGLFEPSTYLSFSVHMDGLREEHDLSRQKTHELFSKMLENTKARWKCNQSPLFLQFLMGKYDFECTPWGNPTYNMFGWQRPCYLLQEGYASTFKELMETTRWEGYGHRSGNEKCKDCMVHCGYEPTAVNTTLTSCKAFNATVEP